MPTHVGGSEPTLAHFCSRRLAYYLLNEHGHRMGGNDVTPK